MALLCQADAGTTQTAGASSPEWVPTTGTSFLGLHAPNATRMHVCTHLSKIS